MTDMVQEMSERLLMSRYSRNFDGQHWSSVLAHTSNPDSYLFRSGLRTGGPSYASSRLGSRYSPPRMQVESL